MSSIARFGLVGISIPMIRDKLQCGKNLESKVEWKKEKNVAHTYS